VEFILSLLPTSHVMSEILILRQIGKNLVLAYFILCFRYLVFQEFRFVTGWLNVGVVTIMLYTYKCILTRVYCVSFMTKCSTYSQTLLNIC